MIVCFDLRALQIGHQNRGIGMYIKSVLENLPPDNNKYLFYIFDKTDPIKEMGIKLQIDYELVATPTIKTSLNSPKDIVGLLRLITHRFKPLKSYRPDVFLQFDFTLGTPRWKDIRTIVIGYDLIPLIMKNDYLPSLSFAIKHAAPHRPIRPKSIVRSVIFRVRNRSFKFNRNFYAKQKLHSAVRSIYYRAKYSLHYKTYKRADNIISISEATSNDFIRLLNIRSDRITTIPLAPVLPTDKPDLGLAKKIKYPYIFYIGGTDNRKRIQDIVYAFNIVRGRGANLKLILAGNEFREVESIPSIDGRNAIINSPYKKDIELVGFITDAQKLGLYKKAHSFIFCTVHEGFGLPIIEAMSASCPVISYNNSSIPEAAGTAAILVETGDYVAIADSILELFDEKMRNRIIASGLIQARKFSWDNYIHTFLSVINKN